MCLILCIILFRVAEHNEKISLRVCGGLQELWGLCAKGYRCFFFRGFKDNELFSCGLEWKPSCISFHQPLKKGKKKQISLSPIFYTISSMNSIWVNKWLDWHGSNPVGTIPRADKGGQKALPFFYILTLLNPHLSAGFLFCDFSLGPKLYGRSKLSWSTNVTKHSHFLSTMTPSDLLNKGGTVKPSLSKLILSYVMSTEQEGKTAEESMCILETWWRYKQANLCHGTPRRGVAITRWADRSHLPLKAVEYQQLL